jgi:hypothetical protein
VLVSQEQKGGKWKVSLACSRGTVDRAWGVREVAYSCVEVLESSWCSPEASRRL